MIPEFAILGHPNEGKSSVISTLAEDDSVKISPTPGETVSCRTFPVCIDRREIIRFTDTPGFQNPGKMLHLLQGNGTGEAISLEKFYQDNHKDPDMEHDCELVLPLIRGAGIIYVADGSRPLRKVDLAEMEILRLTGKPRMAILNCKNEDDSNLEQWKTEFRKHFNSSQVFNAHRATYRERIRLLEALKSIEQDWHESLNTVVNAFKNDWQNRNRSTADIICNMLRECLTHNLTSEIGNKEKIDKEKEKLYDRYSQDIKKIEQRHHQQIRRLFKHNIFNYQLPPQSIYYQDLFSGQTWKLLGLRRKQLAIAGGLGGAALAAGIDLAVGGASLGLFTTMGGALGALGAVYGSKNLASKIKVPGISSEKYVLTVGPNENTQFPFILLDRLLIYYSHIINWAHSRRDHEEGITGTKADEGFASNLESSTIKILSKYFRLLQKDTAKAEEYEYTFKEEIIHVLARISH